MEYVNEQDADVPALGFGTWQISGPACGRAVRDALEIGYRHIDTAQAYENEREVGRGIAESDVDRDDIFLTTKIWHRNLKHDDVIRTGEQSLTRLDVEYVDLLLVHWPVEEIAFQETLDAMRSLQNDDKVRYIGVSNFTPSQLQQAGEHAPLLCNQVEYHPFLSQNDLLDVVREHDMMLAAYSPLARGRVLQDDTLQSIGAGYDKTAAQVALRWLVQQENVAAIPKAADHQHRVENFQIFDFELTDDEMDQIAELDRGQRIIDPSFAPSWER